MKRILSFVLILAFIMGIVVVPASAEEQTIRNRRCEYCATADLDWYPLSAADAGINQMEEKHYYLTEDIPLTKQMVPMGTVCLDLNGHTISSTGRAMLVSGAQYTEGRPILNIMDSVGEGKVISTGGTNNPAGGVVTVSNGGILNLYSGTLKHISTSSGITTCGGVVAAYTSKSGNAPEFNMFGGCVDASEVVLGDDSGNKISSCTDGSGGAIAVYNGGIANLTGGHVIAGKANAIGYGDCVFLNDASSKVIIGGDAQVDEIYFNIDPASNFSIDGVYTGTTKLTYNPSLELEDGKVVGNIITSGSIADATIDCGNEGFFVVADDTDLVLSYADPNAEAAVIDGKVITNYDTWEEAFEKANGKLVRLNKPISEAVDVDADLYLDLNGCSVTGKITVADGKTLYCMDSETDDFTVADENYGRLYSVEGSVKGIPVESALAQNGYLMITVDSEDSEDSEISFHCVDLRLTAMNLRPGSAGVYYVSNFGGDEMVKDKVQMYGVAMSVAGAPTAENMEADCKCSKFYDFEAGNGNENTSTLLNNVLKESNAGLVNRRNANMPVYGRAYLLLEGGTYLFGETAVRSFKDQVEDSSDIWDDLTLTQKDGAYAMYLQYRDFMKQWDLINYFAYKDPSKDNVLKILNISNSHGQDAVNLLPEVLKAEMPDQAFLVVELYQSYALTEHVQAAKNDDPAYVYLANDGVTADGTWVRTEGVSIKQAIQSHSWDIIMFNESSRHLGLESKMSQGMVDWFADYIRSNVDYEFKMLYDMTWANPTDEKFYTDTSRQPAPSTFKNTYTQAYGFDRTNHYNKLVEMTKKYLVNNDNFYKIIDNATPVEYAWRIMDVPEYDENQVYDLYRDYTHISDFARLMVAYNWYCQMFDIEELTEVKVDLVRWEMRAPWGNRHQKLGDLTITEDHKDVILESVNHTLKNPMYVPEKTN